MGNNSAFSSFEDVILAVYNKGVLDSDLLTSLSKAFQDQDADSGGYSGVQADDGKNLLEIVASVSGKEIPERPQLPDDRKDWTSEHEEANESYQSRIWEIFNDATGI